MKLKSLLYPAIAVASCNVSLVSADSFVADNDDTIMVEATAEERLKEQPGVSVITRDNIRKKPPVNDVSELVRTMPGVNLTGNSATGSRGNNRQIDIRGMGPENTLIMIDGIPVNSRSSVRYSWRGERDTRGDSNWVPAEQIERIEVIRGPAAARYGSGASGGVVNIITKRPTNNWHGSLSAYANQPQSRAEGDTRRTGFSLSGPLAEDTLSMRLYGNANRTEADSWNINAPTGRTKAAGREGVNNRDIDGVLSWDVSPEQIVDIDAGYSRQGNIYAGDTQNNLPNATIKDLAQAGAETNRLYRQHYGITHNGIWGWGQSRLGLSYQKTNNTRMKEGLAGGGEGRITGDRKFITGRLSTYRLFSEVHIPADLHTLTFGSEWSRDELDDPAAMELAIRNGFRGMSPDAIKRSRLNTSEISSLFVEDYIEPIPGTSVIPGVRYDYLARHGGNLSPSLNMSQEVNDFIRIKAGIARAYKAPNLYQSNEGYLLYSKGNGCPKDLSSGGCYLVGNSALKPEISVNKEAGIEFSWHDSLAGITWFRNDYKNKIISGDRIAGKTSSGISLLQWQNGGEALIEGIEASLSVPVIKNTLRWKSNATYMMNSVVKKTGNPLSVIPEYTLNHTLGWAATGSLSADMSWTMYGRQKPRTHPETRSESQGKGFSGKTSGAYSIVGLNVNYDATKNVQLNAGVSNVLDKRLYRSGIGASTYNEPGRAFHAGVTLLF
ncbi:TPA: TonB-dependent siderophore receptor [Enterobacter cloacae]|nr:TonB-dependent siderophore receptor [Enterobacter cloacae]